MNRPDIDLRRDDFLLGDLRNLEQLAKLEHPERDQVRLYAATVRRLLLDGELGAAVGRRGLPLEFTVPDSQPLVRSARGNHIAQFYLMGMKGYGHLTAFMSPGPNGYDSDADEFNPDGVVDLNLKEFLRQEVAFCGSEFLTRYDAITYVANKVAGGHYDTSSIGRLNESKMRALGELMDCFRIRAEGSSLLLDTGRRTTNTEPGGFKYEPGYIGGVFLELLACVTYILENECVHVLRRTIERDLLHH
ncbi:hypothetical protein M0D69_03810 [Caballeronia sp. SEWSISQ10-4 2]|uniref:hypothetical protein n=1 Tax=Caballeronia sp. SEWSISQ10-4 2 TaxID=2937438 RepID=UPI002655CC52|nr:hypothetical protein [Caballeronia sp. SEWSISQ10-4 2]MDN7177149.1 hypothetical protein [Caballeronia sp. SEWSISQ10-4 2]